MSTAVYLRVSTKAQDIKSQSVRIQDWLDGHKEKIQAKHWYIDKESGDTLKRPAFDKLKTAIFNGHIDHVVMYGLDRFARNMIDGLVEIDQWQRKKVKLTFVTDQMELDFGTWQGQIVAKIMVAVKLAFAEAEQQKRRTRQRDGIEKAKRVTREAKRLRLNGMTKTQIARHLEVPVEWVEKMLVPGRDVYWGGNEGSRGKSKVDRKKLKRLIEKGLTNQELMRVFKCNESTITRQRKKIGLEGTQGRR